jgi:predicted nucleic acid-binding protein
VNILFLDSSALVKRYVTEVGSAWVKGGSDPAAGNKCWGASVTRVEVAAALYRRVRTRALSLGQARRVEAIFRSELGTLLQSIPVGVAVLTDAMRLVATYPFRAYDAVQLATALSLRTRNATFGLAEPLFVCADQSLILAAAAEGLRTDDPNLHP